MTRAVSEVGCMTNGWIDLIDSYTEKAVSGIADVLCLCFSGSDIKIMILDPPDHYTQTSSIEFD